MSLWHIINLTLDFKFLMIISSPYYSASIREAGWDGGGAGTRFGWLVYYSDFRLMLKPNTSVVLTKLVIVTRRQDINGERIPAYWDEHRGEQHNYILM